VTTLEQLSRTRSASLDAGAVVALGFQQAVADALAMIGAQVIARDFVVPSTDALERFNGERGDLPPGWVAFAESGKGDLWLVRTSGAAEVALLDHDFDGAATAEQLGIDFAQWVELAWFMRGRDAERKASKDPSVRRALATRTRAFLESLSPGLVGRYPYAVR